MRTHFFLSVATLGIALVVTGCPKKEPAPVVDAAPVDTTPPPPPEPVSLTTEEPDAGEEDAGADAGKKPTGPGVSTNVARLLRCCSQLSAEAKRMGNSPEAGLFQQAATQCSATARSLGPNASAPELGALRTLLAGRTLPNVCAGF